MDRSEQFPNLAADAPVYVPQEMYRWTLYDTPLAVTNHLRAVYRHDTEPYWLAIAPHAADTHHEATIFTETGTVTSQAETDAQCLLNLVTREQAVLDGCRVVLTTGVMGSDADAYRHAELS